MLLECEPGRRRVANCTQCFRYICTIPPSPLTEEDIWFQIGHVYEQNTDVSVSGPRGMTPF